MYTRGRSPILPTAAASVISMRMEAFRSNHRHGNFVFIVGQHVANKRLKLRPRRGYFVNAATCINKCAAMMMMMMMMMMMTATMVMMMISKTMVMTMSAEHPVFTVLTSRKTCRWLPDPCGTGQEMCNQCNQDLSTGPSCFYKCCYYYHYVYFFYYY